MTTATANSPPAVGLLGLCRAPGEILSHLITEVICLSGLLSAQSFVVGDPVRNPPLLDVNIRPADALTSYVRHAHQRPTFPTHTEHRADDPERFSKTHAYNQHRGPVNDFKPSVNTESV